MNKREWMLQAAVGALAGGFGPLDVEELSSVYDAIVAASPEPSDSGWIEHRGEKPYPEGRVDIELRGGIRRQGVDSDDLVWTHDPDEPDGNILLWRPARA